MPCQNHNSRTGLPPVRTDGESPSSSTDAGQARYQVVGSVGEGLNLRLGDNLLQTIVMLVCGAAGAVIGYNAVPKFAWGGMAYGLSFGILAGAFLGGLLLLCPARRRNLVTLSEFLKLQSKAKRRLSLAAAAFILAAVAFPLIVAAFGGENSLWGSVFCLLGLMLLGGLCAYTKGIGSSGQLQLRCPECGTPVPVSSDPSSRRCNNCDFEFQ